MYTNFNNKSFQSSAWILKSGDRYNGIYESTIALSPDEIGPGTLGFGVASWYIKDPNGYEASGINGINVEVVNNSDNDFDKPVLSSFTISPTSVDLSSGAVTLTANLNISDASGVVTPGDMECIQTSIIKIFKVLHGY